MSNLAKLPKEKLLSLVENGRRRMANARAETAAIAKRAVVTGIAPATAAGMAVVSKKYGTGSGKDVLVPGTKAPADLGGGIVLGLVGVSGLLGDETSDYVASVGSGLLSEYWTKKILLG